ncbi:hypothetical protein C8A05DRAFT_19550 [Staphylotrichum tortipilum]|uniref:Uncharacterized protein n=1 Tax=Staphylotrichum tortipilum TaxID=2831512 RepID=A0AAN6RPU1_9PEZI|nr:hypothetical protein C8A05DRAFT_19550 [Staphylotrichum longicolle]
MSDVSLESDPEDAAPTLEAVMAAVAPDTEVLHIAGDTPTNDQWVALGQHFTNVRFLIVCTGWNECWVDDDFPLNWPLELLVISDASSERVSTPAIMEGRVKHLVLFYAHGLRFEGPSTEELMKDAEMLHFVPREKKATYDTDPEAKTGNEEPTEEAENGDESDGIKVYSVPYEWNKWVTARYQDQELCFSAETPDGAPPSAMEKLDIVGNDALRMVIYMALAKAHIVFGLQSLNLDSPSSNDLFDVPPSIILALLPALLNLKSLRLTLGSCVYSTLLDAAVENDVPFLHAALPANLETLQFRGPVSAAPHLGAFVSAFAKPDFLPDLKRISLVLDLPDEASNSPKEATLPQLRAAHEACKKVLDAAAARGVEVEAFVDPWVEYHSGLRHGIDNRWEVLDEIASAGQ